MTTPSIRQDILLPVVVILLALHSSRDTTTTLCLSDTELSHVSYFLPRCHHNRILLEDNAMLRKLIQNADYVFSGRVLNVVSVDVANSLVYFNVLVKRFFKNSEILLTPFQHVRVVKRMEPGEGVQCRQTLRAKFMGIFIANISHNDSAADLRLLVDVVSVTLRHLDAITNVTGALKVFGYGQLQSPYYEDPCKLRSCKSGKHCVVQTNGEPICVCTHNCTNNVWGPICASDGTTYGSSCDFNFANCKSGGTLFVVSDKKCVAEKSLSCANITCDVGQECLPNNKFAPSTCVCAQSCSKSNVTNTTNYVCGTDGIDYENECELKRKACRTRKKIDVQHRSKCNPCADKNCGGWSDACKLDQDRKPYCNCSFSCFEQEQYVVCGTDGRSYQNKCTLHKAACHAQNNLHLFHWGPCLSNVTEVHNSTVCTNNAIFSNGHCVCPKNCSGVADEPICSSDMVTYANECEFQRSICEMNNNSSGSAISNSPPKILFYGECYLSATSASSTPTDNHAETPSQMTRNLSTEQQANMIACDRHTCQYGATCHAESDGMATCFCVFNCSTNNPRTARVCGSDYNVYPSMCHLERASCQTQSRIKVLQFGKCRVKPRQKQQRRCNNTKFGCCPDGKTIAKDKTHASCPNACRCNRMGTNGNRCDPKTAKCHCKLGVEGPRCNRCKSGYWGLRKTSKTHSSGCSPCGCSAFGSVREDCEQMTGRCVCRAGVHGHKCTACLDHNKVLGPNGCVSPDIVTLPARTCEQLTCYFGATCTRIDGTATCVCHMDCSNYVDNRTVCGSDGYTYMSLCHLKQTACKTQKDLVLRSLGSCEGKKKQVSPVTDVPSRQYTTPLFTEPYEISIPLAKSTRNLLSPSSRYYYEQGGLATTIVRPKHANFHINPSQYDREPNLRSTFGKKGPFFQDFKYPLFSGQSYILTTALGRSNSLIFIMVLVVYNMTGIILFCQETLTEKGDYFSLSLINGHVEFRMRIQSVEILIRSERPVPQGRPFTITGKRYSRFFTLAVDGIVLDVINDGFDNLFHHLYDFLHIGYVLTNDSRIHKKMGTIEGFQGCIHKLTVYTQNVLGDKRTYGLIKHSYNVADCGEAGCGSQLLENVGKCVKVPSLTPDYTNRKKSSENVNIALHGEGYIRMPAAWILGPHMSFRIVMMTTSLYGSLLFCRQAEYQKYEYLYVELYQGQPRLRLVYQNKRINLTANKFVADEKWHTLGVHANETALGIYVDNMLINSAPLPNQTKFTPYGHKTITHIGKLLEEEQIFGSGNISVGFDGVIGRFQVNNEYLPLDATLGTSCDSASFLIPCNVNASRFTGEQCPGRNGHCLNGAKCVSGGDYFKCNCAFLATGRFCESFRGKVATKAGWSQMLSKPNKSNIRHPNFRPTKHVFFNGSVYLTFKERLVHDLPEPYKMTFEIRFRPLELNSLLLWAQANKSDSQDDFTIAIVDGHVMFYLNPDHFIERLAVRSSIELRTNQWYTVTLKLSGWSASIVVNHEKPVMGSFSKPIATLLEDELDLYVGGAPRFPDGFKKVMKSQFKGCMRHVHVNDRPLRLAKGLQNGKLTACKEPKNNYRAKKSRALAITKN